MLVLAKSREAARELSKSLQHGSLMTTAEQYMQDKGKDTWKKVYWALVYGRPSTRAGLIDLPLYKGQSVFKKEDIEVDRVQMCSRKAGKEVDVNPDVDKDDSVDFEADEGAQDAFTHFRVISFTNDGFSWLELRPLTVLHKYKES